MKKIPKKLIKKVEKEIKMLLHAHRDGLRDDFGADLRLGFITDDGYYGEAFGILRALQIQGYGDYGPVNLDGIKVGFEQKEQNLHWWFSKLKDEVLSEEHWDTDHRCKYCLKKYGKDDKSLLEEIYGPDVTV